MRTFTSAADKQVSQRLLKACTAIIDQYRKEVRHLPVWLDELDAADALKLLAASTRLGMKLPRHETLEGDWLERGRADTRASIRPSRKR